MAKPDLVFVTKDNAEKVKAFAEGKAYRCRGCGNNVLGMHDCPGLFTGKDSCDETAKPEPEVPCEITLVSGDEIEPA